jgi:hypothetical protein
MSECTDNCIAAYNQAHAQIESDYAAEVKKCDPGDDRCLINALIKKSSRMAQAELDLINCLLTCN